MLCSVCAGPWTGREKKQTNKKENNLWNVFIYEHKFQLNVLWPPEWWRQRKSASSSSSPVTSAWTPRRLWKSSAEARNPAKKIHLNWRSALAGKCHTAPITSPFQKINRLMHQWLGRDTFYITRKLQSELHLEITTHGFYFLEPQMSGFVFVCHIDPLSQSPIKISTVLAWI